MDQSRRQYVYGSADWSCFSSEFAEEVSTDDVLNALNYYTIDHNAPKQEVRHTEIDLIADIYRKIIFRGTRTFLQPEVEEMLHQLFPKKDRPSPDTEKQHAVAYLAPEPLRKRYKKPKKGSFRKTIRTEKKPKKGSFRNVLIKPFIFRILAFTSLIP
jgi:hypothetical protein